MTNQQVLRGFSILEPWKDFKLSMLTKGTYGVIGLNGKFGGFIIVDIDDYYKYCDYSWVSDENGYIRGKINGKSVLLSRIISGAKENEITDHINGFRHDNTRKNLRNTTYVVNGGNRRINRNKFTSTYRYVYFDKKNNKYKAYIIINYINYWLGVFKTELEAVDAVDMFITHEPVAKNKELIFKDKKQEYLKREYKPYIKPKKLIKYIGVTKNHNNYNANIEYKKIKHYLGTSPDPIICAKLSDQYIVDNNIPKKILNFPEDYPNYDPNHEIKTLCENYDDKSVKLLLNTNDLCLVNKEDYEKIKYYTCTYNKIDKYVTIKINKKSLRLSRYLMDLKNSSIYSDHIYGNRTDNRKEKLRISNAAKNAQNRLKTKSFSTSKYVGTCFDKKSNKWHSYITFNGKTKSICFTDDEISAVRIREIYIMTYLPDEHYVKYFSWTTEDKEYWLKKLNDYLTGKIQKLNKNNQHKKEGTSSNYIGVNFNKLCKKWQSLVIRNKKNIFKCYSTDEITAARFRDIYIIKNLKNKGYKLNLNWTKKEEEEWTLKLDKQLILNQKNCRNRKKMITRTTTTNKIGITYDIKSKKWICTILKNKKSLFRYSCNDEIEATKMRDIFLFESGLDKTYAINLEWTDNQKKIWKYKLKKYIENKSNKYGN
jgi:hypothetical protein